MLVNNRNRSDAGRDNDERRLMGRPNSQCNTEDSSRILDQGEDGEGQEKGPSYHSQGKGQPLKERAPPVGTRQ